MWDSKTKERTKSQKVKILELLRSAGEEGVTNTTLSNIALHYGKRFSELYSVGYVITNEDLGNGLVKYVLVSEPEQIISPPKAIDVLKERLDNDDYSYLIDALNQLNITVRFKNGEYKKV